MKVIVRGSYGHRGPGGDYRSYSDPPKSHIKKHIEQLAPVFAANEDVIALFEAGSDEFSPAVHNLEADERREILNRGFQVSVEGHLVPSPMAVLPVPMVALPERSRLRVGGEHIAVLGICDLDDDFVSADAVCEVFVKSIAIHNHARED